jgi:hypothetical protein
LFYLEAADYTVEEPEEPDKQQETPASEQPPFDPEAPLISLSTITGIRTEDMM